MKKIFLIFLYLLSPYLLAQESQKIMLEWNGYKQHSFINKTLFKYPAFKGNSLDVNIRTKSILFTYVFKTNAVANPETLAVNNIIWETITEADLYDLDKSNIPSQLEATIETVTARNDFYTTLLFSPIIKEGSIYKRVKSLQFSYINKSASSRFIQNTTAIQNSILTNGNWYRFYVEKSGIYKITKSFLQSLGLDVNTDPRTIKIYGNGGAMLPLLNSEYYPVDLEENAIQFIGEEDGVFNDSDYILFYAEGTDTWNAESLTSINLYDDKSYYYVTSQGSYGKRIQENTQPTSVPIETFSKYNTKVVYEQDLVNVAKVGRRWFGEQFNITNTQDFEIVIPNLDTTQPIDVKINLAATNPNTSSFDIGLNGQNIGNVPIANIPNDAGFLARESALNITESVSSQNLNFTITYNNNGIPSANGYLDFISIDAVCNLQGIGNQFLFYNNNQASNIGVGEFVITNAPNITQVWDITDLYNATKFSNAGSTTFSFKVNLGETRKYVAVDNTSFLDPLKEINTQVLNQNLKGTIFLNNQGNFQDIDYLIITPVEFYNQAEQLANFHRTESNLKVKVAKLNEIYQEFSSGKQDIAAIRNFIKYVYQNASSTANQVKYINLFGDASYDYKDRIFNNSNYVPIFHSFNPLATEINNTSNMSLYTTIMSDDFYGLMDDNEGPMTSNTDGIDIAVGRMLINNTQQANEMVAKIQQYYDQNSYGKWRNSFVIYSDDADDAGDASLQFHLDGIADDLAAAKPFVNVKKIHTDAYIQEVASGGERYPEAKEDFLNAIELGALVINYFGHGNEEFLAKERLFEKLNAQELTNPYQYPLFITITCEFTRFDDPNRLTGGEYMYWNANGGAISLIATTRQIGVSTGLNMNNLLTEILYDYGGYNYPTISEALRITKILTSSTNRRVVSYIGDPALQLAIPKPQVVLTKVNDVAVGGTLPVFQALELMKVEGEIQNESGNLLADYNGDVAIQIFDKNINRTTLGNDGATNSSGQLITMDFTTLGETIVRGNATVTNGTFEFSFIVPQDIRIPVGNGKISFYAKRTQNTLQDQTGYDLSIQVGGVNENAVADNTAPTMQLFMNDESFVSGDITNCSPILLVKLQDEHGINTASGIGHDIVAILDGEETNPYILNDYYETELDDFTQGIIKFPFRNLEAGMHTILVKAWDVYNNPVSLELQFNAVCSIDGLQIQRVLNYPNPFVSYTEFWFTHNMPFEPLDVQVQILTITGKLVKTINQQVVTNGFLCRDIKWNGLDDFGDKIGKGVYVYKLTVKSTTTGSQVEKYEKLVIL